jgi:hypothetical protein
MMVAAAVAEPLLAVFRRLALATQRRRK